MDISLRIWVHRTSLLPRVYPAGLLIYVASRTWTKISLLPHRRLNRSCPLSTHLRSSSPFYLLDQHIDHMLQTLAEASLLALVAPIFHLSIGSPPPPVPKGERSKGVDPRGFMTLARTGMWLYHCLLYSLMVSETTSFVIRNRLLVLPGLRGENAINALNGICPPSFTPDMSTQARLPTVAMTGCLISISASLFRLWDRLSLGQFFTWEVSIRPGHKLYTKGPYSFVRHPAYAGWFASVVGQAVFVSSRGTFLRVCVQREYPRAFYYGTIFRVSGLEPVALVCSAGRARRMECLKGSLKEWEE